MASRFSAENLKSTTLTQEIEPVARTGTRNTEYEIVVSSAPTAETWWVVVDYNVVTKVDCIFYHRRSGNTLYYYRSQRDLFNVWAYTKYHEVWAYVRVHDVAEFINHIYENINDFWYVKQYSDNNVVVFWGTILNPITWVETIIADQSLTYSSDDTYYIYIDTSDYSFNSSTTAPTSEYYSIATVVVTSSVIASITDTRPVVLTQWLSAEITDLEATISANSDVAANTAARHTHANLAVLDATTASFTTDDETKLDWIEAWADVTDTTNVTAAWALMDSELASIADVKALNQSVVSGASPVFTNTNFTESTNKRYMSDAQEAKIDYITVTQAVDLDQMELDIAALSSAVTLQWTWDASVGTFPWGWTAQSWYSYIVSVWGTVDGEVFVANDRILATTDNASTTTYASNWHKLDYTDQVLSVAWKTGAVTLVIADITDFTDNSTNWDTAYTHSQATTWNPHSVTKSDVWLGSVENTALSTWAWTSNITTLWTVATWTWNATAISHEKWWLEADVSAYAWVPLISWWSTIEIKYNLVATVAPDANDDIWSWYVVWSRWIDVTNDKEYVCLDNSSAAAVWAETTSTWWWSSPLTTKWDLYTYDTADARLPIGTDWQVLTADSAEATGMKWSTVAWSWDMVLASAQTNTGVKTFADGTMKLRNVADTFDWYFTNTNTADRVYTLPDAAGTVALTSNLHDAVTLAGTPDYLTISGQEITLGQIDLTADVTGDLPFANIAQIATNRILGRSSAGTGDIEALADSAARTIMWLATSDSPQFTGINLWHATDTTLTRVSAWVIAVEGQTIATQAYAEGLFASNDAMIFKGVIDCSTNPNYPAADAGHTYKISVAGKIGWASGINVEVGDTAICSVDSTASGDQATVGANWFVVQVNLDWAVIWPASSTDWYVALFDWTTGKLIKNSTLNPSNILLSSNIGSSVQAYDAWLTSIAGLTTAADRMIYTTASDTYAVTTLTAAGRALIDDASASAQRTTLWVWNSDSPQFAGVNVGHATDTTITRVSAGVIAVEWVTVPTISSTSTFSNKTIALGSNTLSGTKAQFDTACTDWNFLYTDNIGSSVQAYDADTAKLDVAQTRTAKQTFDEIGIDSIPDTDHTATWPTTSVTSGATVTAFQVCMLQADGKFDPADASAVATANGMLVLALEAKNDTEAMQVALPWAFVRDDTWAWTVGGIIYLSETTGDMTQTAPTTTGAIVRILWYALSADVVYFAPSMDFIENA